MNLNPESLMAKVTPTPDINTQVVNELKGAVGTAKEKTVLFFQNREFYS